MEEYAILNLDHSRIEKILFEYYCKDYGPNGKAKMEPTFKVECNVKNKIGLISHTKSVEFLAEYYTPMDSLAGSFCEKISFDLTDFNNIINEIVGIHGYEIDYLEIESKNNSKDKEALDFLKYRLKKKEKVKTKKKGWK